VHECAWPLRRSHLSQRVQRVRPTCGVIPAFPQTWLPHGTGKQYQYALVASSCAKCRRKARPVRTINAPCGPSTVHRVCGNGHRRIFGRQRVGTRTAQRDHFFFYVGKCFYAFSCPEGAGM
jgi:hypothetical protein